MSQQQDHVTCIQVSNLVGSNNGKDSGTTGATITPVSNKCLKSAHDWIHERWYKIFFLMCVIALWLDPLFCYSLGIDNKEKCIRVDNKLMTIAIVLRSVIDSLYVIHVISKFRTGISLPQANGRVVAHKTAWAITKSYLVDILSVLPLPQVVFPIIISRKKYLFVKEFNIFLVFFQYVPRIIRIYPLFKAFARTYGILIGSATLNLFLYMLACHVVGAFWYLFAVERQLKCWHEACKNRIGCDRPCDNNLVNNTFLTDSCPIKPPNETIFDFGIFHGALHSGIANSTDFLQKFTHSFWFGLQSLSSLGQNLKTSTYLWETIFAVIVSIIGLILLVFLIGNMQTYLQFRIGRLEEMRFTEKEIARWLGFHSPPRNLKNKINKHKQDKWREIRGVENLLHNLPMTIRSATMRHLCSNALKKVPMLENIDKDKRLSDAICEHLKQVFYKECSCVVRERDPLDKMLFIKQGTLFTYNSNDSTDALYLVKDDFYGEELLKWALKSPSLDNIPFSTKTVHALTKVEAFALTAIDLKNVVSKFWWLFIKEARDSPSFELEQWEKWSASAIQTAWRRRYYRNKKNQETRKFRSNLCLKIY